MVRHSETRSYRSEYGVYRARRGRVTSDRETSVTQRTLCKSRAFQRHFETSRSGTATLPRIVIRQTDHTACRLEPRRRGADCFFLSAYQPTASCIHTRHAGQHAGDRYQLGWAERSFRKRHHAGDQHRSNGWRAAANNIDGSCARGRRFIADPKYTTDDAGSRPQVLVVPLLAPHTSFAFVRYHPRTTHVNAPSRVRHDWRGAFSSSGGSESV